MSYQVLARKWRPRSFKDMVGQEHILRMLSNALQQKRIHHAYLFTGTRGVGKTTLARIIAKCLNCEAGIGPHPCQTCPACISIDQGQFLDLYEVDAASRTKVEDTRELLDNVLYPPNHGRYKIYLIDEVHMLSNHSFNALLKTLEEPPPHVKFLLATTDPKRLPITILSRCLQFHLKRIQIPQIAAQLKHVCDEEQIAYDQEALEPLAQAADGSMRDALSLLDQAIAYGLGKISVADVSDMLGNVAQTDIIPLVAALKEQNGAHLFACADQLFERAPDFNQVLESMISLFHQIALQQVIPDVKNATDAVKSLASEFSLEDVQLFYQIALLTRRDLALTPHPQQGFEMMLMRMLALKPALLTKTARDQEPTPRPQPAAAKAPLSKNRPEQAAALLPASEAKPLPPLGQELDWRNLLQQLNLSGMALALASNCTLVNLSGQKIELALSANHQPMLNPKLKERIEEAIAKHFKQPMSLEITITSEELFTPVKASQQEQQEKLEKAKETVMQDPKIKQLIEMYDATVEVSFIS